MHKRLSRKKPRIANAFPDAGIDIYLRQIAKTAPLSAKEECELAALIQKGDKRALNKLVLANLRFVVSVAHTYSNQGVPISDLINIGNLGLLRAAKKFDGKKNFKFISYAVWYIRQAILTELANQSRLVRLPVNQAGLIYKVEQTKQKIQQRKSRDATIQEIADDLGIPSIDIIRITQTTAHPSSFDAPIEDGHSTLYDKIASDDQAQESFADISLSREIENLLGLLDEREKEIISLYFGIGTEVNFTLEEIGERLNITRERVRQIKENALKKLKTSVQPTAGFPFPPKIANSGSKQLVS